MTAIGSEVDIDYFLKPKTEETPQGTSLVPHNSEPEEAVFEEIEEVEPASLIPQPLRGIDLSRVESRLDLVKALAKNLPVNEFNLPLFIYRPDLLDITVTKMASEQDDYELCSEMLQSSEVPVEYEHGYPTIVSGTPLWGRMPFEEDIAFQAFLQYLEQPGVRMLSTIVSESLDALQNWYGLNYWHIRALAYDMYKLVHHTRLREHRILALNDKHYARADAAFDKLSTALGNKLNDPEALKEMDVNDLVNAIDKVVKIQRMAAGLSTTGVQKEGETKSSSVEVTMREVSQTSTPQISRDEDTDISGLLQDSKLLEKAQEVIIRVTNNQ